MTSLPEISEAQRLELRPGDALVVRLEIEPNMDQARHVSEVVRNQLGRPDLHVLVIGPCESVEVLGDAGARDGPG